MSILNALKVRPRHILELSPKEKREFLDSFEIIFSDIDGVLWNLDDDIEGSSEGFEVLKNAGKRLVFITNNSVREESQCIRKFQLLNMTVDAKDIVHPAKTMVEYLRSIHFNGLIYIIACETFKDVLKKAGFKLIDGPTKIIKESYLDLAHHIFDRKPVRAVIVDVDFNMSSTKLIRAQMYLNHPECLLIAGATDMLLPVCKDLHIIGPGPFAKILAEASKKPMIALGKPGKDLATITTKHYGITQPKRVLMIGDMLAQDVRFGKEGGFQTLLVLSGGCSQEDLDSQTNAELTPDYYAGSMGDFVEFMNDVPNTSE